MMTCFILYFIRSIDNLRRGLVSFSSGRFIDAHKDGLKVNFTRLYNIGNIAAVFKVQTYRISI